MTTNDWESGNPIKAVVDCRCGCARCEKGNSGMYRMVGYCLNCGTKPILFLFRAGDPARPGGQACPICANIYKLETVRLATPDEIPASGVGL